MSDGQPGAFVMQFSGDGPVAACRIAVDNGLVSLLTRLINMPPPTLFDVDDEYWTQRRAWERGRVDTATGSTYESRCALLAGWRNG